MPIQHHHLLLRMEIQNVPVKQDIPKIKQLLKQIILDLNMNILGIPHIYYVDTPKSNKGITGTVSIQTSHMSFHIWESPQKTLLNKSSKGLLQFDIYTCGGLNTHQLYIVLNHLSMFSPSRIDLDMFDRKQKLKLDYHYEWNNDE
jgi:S-adenosylmethionine/arginine decarboxylase-like enzyme